MELIGEWKHICFLSPVNIAFLRSCGRHFWAPFKRNLSWSQPWWRYTIFKTCCAINYIFDTFKSSPLLCLVIPASSFSVLGEVAEYSHHPMHTLVACILWYFGSVARWELHGKYCRCCNRPCTRPLPLVIVARNGSEGEWEEPLTQQNVPHHLLLATLLGPVSLSSLHIRILEFKGIFSLFISCCVHADWKPLLHPQSKQQVNIFY